MPKKRAKSREGMIITTMALEPALHRRLAIAAVEDNAAINELLRQAAKEWLERRESKGKRKGKS
jgi:hypothetical protein